MRVGQNPAKSITQVPQPARITIALITYIPFLSGYYKQSLDVLKICLNSVLQNTPRSSIQGSTANFDLYVFDNGSCEEVRGYLIQAQTAGDIQYLLLSQKNLGKGGAWNIIFESAPGEIIVYADSDVYFSEGWLEHSLDILEKYPNVGMVTARPMRTPAKYFTSTLEWAQGTPDVKFEEGDFQSWETFKEHTDSVGVDEAESREWYQESKDIRLTYHDSCAQVGAAHFQFMAKKKVLRKIIPFEMDRPMGQVRVLDEQLNNQGYLRLATCEPYVKHLGNRVPTTGMNTASQITSHRGKRLVDAGPVRKSLLWLYNRIFKLYFEGNH